jgi:hypothetical protein
MTDIEKNILRSFKFQKSFIYLLLYPILQNYLSHFSTPLTLLLSYKHYDPYDYQTSNMMDKSYYTSQINYQLHIVQ